MRACNDAANLAMGPGNDAASLEMGPANGLRPTASGQAGPEEVSTDSVSQPGPQEVSTAPQSASSISSILKCALATTLRVYCSAVSKLDQ